MAKHGKAYHKAQFQNAIRQTQDTEAIVLQTIQHCLDLGGSHTEPSHMRLLQDTADIANATMRVLARRSPHRGEVVDACATIAEACAKALEPFSTDPVMKAAANQCLILAMTFHQAPILFGQTYAEHHAHAHGADQPIR